MQLQIMPVFVGMARFLFDFTGIAKTLEFTIA
jgi:hypothetical protein